MRLVITIIFFGAIFNEINKIGIIFVLKTGGSNHRNTYVYQEIRKRQFMQGFNCNMISGRRGSMRILNISKG